MGLNIRLAPGEKVVINGCIIKNNGRSRIDIEVENRSDVLRASEMFDADTADTPVKRLCYAVQIALVSKDHRSTMLEKISLMIGDLEAAMRSSHAAEISEISDLIGKGEFYAANRRLRAMMPFEQALLSVRMPNVSGQAA